MCGYVFGQPRTSNSRLGPSRTVNKYNKPRTVYLMLSTLIYVYINGGETPYVCKAKDHTLLSHFLYIQEIHHSLSICRSNLQNQTEHVILWCKGSKDYKVYYFPFLFWSSIVLWHRGGPAWDPLGPQGLLTFIALQRSSGITTWPERHSPGCSARKASNDVKITVNAAKAWPLRAVHNPCAVVQSI